MVKSLGSLLPLLCLLPFSTASPSIKTRLSPSHLLSIRTVSTEIPHGLSNIHLDWSPFSRATSEPQNLSLSYGNCDDLSVLNSHHIVGSTDLSSHQELPPRFVWQVKEDVPTGGCISAWIGEDLIGRSESLDIISNTRSENRKRQISKRDVKMSDFDTNGLWFDGAAMISQKEPNSSFVAKSKSSSIAIVGAGMSGLMTTLLLDSVGVHNYTLIEGGQRYGGRVHTEYLNNSSPSDYQYQEMGPMRFPRSIKYADTNETVIIKDHHLVFQLAEELNKYNAASMNASNLRVDFIPWIQSMSGDLSYYDGIKVNGIAPNKAQVATNSSLNPSDTNPAIIEANSKISALTANNSWIKAVADNVYKAHHDSVLSGNDDWSEFGYLHHQLKYDLNVTDAVASDSAAMSFWSSMYDSVYFGATNWSTIDKGLSSLPNAFWGTLSANKTIMNRKIVKLDQTSDGKAQLFWKPNDTSSSRDMLSAEYDYAIISVPFSIVKQWRLPKFSNKLGRAIENMNYQSACKVALQFDSRFWEHLETPILGGCSSTDIPNIGSVCYPSYKLNSTGPGVMLASYESSDSGQRLAAWSEAQHVQYVVDAMAEMHGDIVYSEYSGNFNRRCWISDPLESASWASPLIGQHKLYMPAYYQTEKNFIFIGEHTSFTHAWIASALESSIRGTVQLLLELGLVDEAKEITKKWMGRWITI